MKRALSSFGGFGEKLEMDMTIGPGGNDGTKSVVKETESFLSSGISFLFFSFHFTIGSFTISPCNSTKQIP
jgi:hypothetical protein